VNSLIAWPMMDYLKFYDLESYLLKEVKERFCSRSELRPLDLFLMLHWKAIRAKTRTKDRLIEKVGGFEKAAAEIAKSISDASKPKERLRVLMVNFHLRLPTATAILTILYPKKFTVYDERVCKQLKNFKPINTYCPDKNWDRIWSAYRDFKQRVIDETPRELSLRDKDRYLWARDFIEQAECDWRKPPKERKS
jgi:hypothetical protein